MVGRVWMIGTAYAVAVGLGVFAGRRHARETGTGAGRLAAAAALMGVAAAAPVAAGVAVGVDGLGLIVVGVALLIMLRVGVTMFRPPVSIPGSKEPLAPLEDEAFLARLREMAGAMGLRPPIVRMLRSTGGELSALAFAGGLPTSSLVVTDGIVHRLDPDERDGIVAHELGHIATRSLWVVLFATSAAWTLGVVLGHGLPILLALAVAANLYMLLPILVQRRFELVCDRRAAGVVGVEVMRSALWKIHRAHLRSARHSRCSASPCSAKTNSPPWPTIAAPRFC